MLGNETHRNATRPIPEGEPPTLLARLLEARAPFEWSALPLGWPRLRRAPLGDGRPVLLVPGFGAGSLSMRPLRSYLSWLGYDARDWEGDRNTGDFEADIVRVGEQCARLSRALGGLGITVIGWSLGGVAAREAARLYPDTVREVITLGTPIVGGPRYTSIGPIFAAARGMDLKQFEQEVHARNSLGFRQPVTSIYSRTDGVVGWRASIDSYNPQARNVEVSGSHLGLGVNPQVWLEIAETLSRRTH